MLMKKLIEENTRMFCGDGGAMCIYIVWCEEGRTSHLV
jgi:hypothetical protein